MLKHTPKKRLKLEAETVKVIGGKKLSNDDLRAVVGGFVTSVTVSQEMT